MLTFELPGIAGWVTKPLLFLESVTLLERRDCDQHNLGLKPTRAILLCPWKRHFLLLKHSSASSSKF